MCAQLNNLYVSSSYQGLLKMTDSTNGVTNTLQTVQTGDGNDTALQISTDAVNISGSFYINNNPITNGSSGTSGTSGSSGVDGSSGTSGTDGSMGSSGTDGTSGTSGTSGSGGSSGTSGDSLFAQTGSYWATTNDLQVTGSIYQTGTFYADAITFVNSPSIVEQTGSYIMTYDATGSVTYDTYPNVAQALSPYITGSSNRDGLITTGSFDATQYISGGFTIQQDNGISGFGTNIFGTNPLIILSQGTDANGVQTGSQYPTLNMYVDSTTYPTDIYGSFAIYDSKPNGDSLNNINFAISTYQPEYGGQPVANIAGGGTYNNPNQSWGNSDTVFGFLSGAIDVFKPTSYKAPVAMTSSLVVLDGITGSLQGTASFTTNFNKTGLITTGSLNSSQTILSSLNLSGSLYANKDIVLSGSNYQTQGAIAILNNQTLQISNKGIGGGYTQSGSVIQLGFNTGSGGNATFQMNAYVSGSSADLSVFNTAGTTKVRGLAQQFVFAKTEGFPNTVADSFEIDATNIKFNGNLNVNGNQFISGSSLYMTGSARYNTPGYPKFFMSGKNSNGKDIESVVLNPLQLQIARSGSAINGDYASSISSLGISVFDNINGNYGNVTIGQIEVGGGNPDNGSSGGQIGIVSDFNYAFGDGQDSPALYTYDNNFNPIALIYTQAQDSWTDGAMTFTKPTNFIETVSIASGSINLNNNGQSQIINTQTGRNVLYVDNDYSNFFFGNVPKSQSGRFSGDTGNFIVSPTYAAFETGSNNILLATGLSNLISGSNNIIIGGSPNFGTSNYQNSLYIGNGDFTLQRNGIGAPLQIGLDTQITGSLNVSTNINNLKIWTGSANVNSIGIGNNTLNSLSGSDKSNIAIGDAALQSNVTGANIVAIGGSALQNSVAGFNLAVGASALNANTTGQYNIAIGQSSYQANTVGERNTAIGYNSGVNNITGSTNTIIGAQALQQNFSGSGNVAIGYGAGYYSTGSNGFYIGNDNYGSLSNEQNKSMMYGEFNGTTANQTLQINAKTSIKNAMNLTPMNPLPSGVVGDLAVSGSNLYFYNGAWTQII